MTLASSVTGLRARWKGAASAGTAGLPGDRVAIPSGTRAFAEVITAAMRAAITQL